MKNNCCDGEKINLVGELDAPIVKANGLAVAKGVEPGMKVRDALALLNREQDKK